MRASSLRRSAARAALGLGVWLASAAAPSPVGAQPADEYAVKAVYLFNFAAFVDWPATAFATPQTAIAIGVLGDDPFGEVLEQVVANERVKNRGLVVKRFRRPEEVTDCHILFISRSEERRFAEVLALCSGRPVLTVSDIDQFAEGGGMIAFALEARRVRLRVNLQALRTADLDASSKLLRSASVLPDR